MLPVWFCLGRGDRTKAVLCLGSLVEARAGCVQTKRQDREHVRTADSVDRRRGLMKRQLEQTDAGVLVCMRWYSATVAGTRSLPQGRRDRSAKRNPCACGATPIAEQTDARQQWRAVGSPIILLLAGDVRDEVAGR